ncbi:DUF4167 domain-containing protein [Acetobacteraceae bacterium]|nr:DUF4167 domain-containing protein [Acetobacteraceae bacterium]
MKSQTRHRRPRGGNIRTSNGQVPLHRNYVFDSNGPNGRLRGTAQQLSEKYQQLARDSKANGDRVHAQALYQYAEHYSRTLSLINQNMQAVQQERAEQRQQRTGSYEQRSSNTGERRPRRERGERTPHHGNVNSSNENTDENPQEENRQWRPSEDHSNNEEGKGEE